MYGTRHSEKHKKQKCVFFLSPHILETTLLATYHYLTFNIIIMSFILQAISNFAQRDLCESDDCIVFDSSETYKAPLIDIAIGELLTWLTFFHFLCDLYFFNLNLTSFLPVL